MGEPSKDGKHPPTCWQGGLLTLSYAVSSEGKLGLGICSHPGLFEPQVKAKKGRDENLFSRGVWPHIFLSAPSHTACSGWHESLMWCHQPLLLCRFACPALGFVSPRFWQCPEQLGKQAGSQQSSAPAGRKGKAAPAEFLPVCPPWLERRDFPACQEEGFQV